MAEATKPLLFIIEDDPVWTALHTKNFGKRYQIRAFTTGQEALHHLQEKPEIVLLDYEGIGEVDAPTTLKQLKQALPRTQVIMCSGQQDVQHAVDVLTSGAYNYVVKREGYQHDVNIHLRNIEQAKILRGQVVHLHLVLQRWKLALIGLVAAILVIGMVIYLQICPDYRPLKWDPFGRGASPNCKYNIPSKGK